MSKPNSPNFADRMEVWERLRLFFGYKFGIRILPERTA